MNPKATMFMPPILVSFNRPEWASQERLTNLGNDNFAYRLTSGVHNLLARFSHTVVGFAVTNHAYTSIFPGYPPPDHAVRDFLTKNGSNDESYHRAFCFIDALFQHTDRILRDCFNFQCGIDEVALQLRVLSLLRSRLLTWGLCQILGISRTDRSREYLSYCGLFAV